MSECAHGYCDNKATVCNYHENIQTEKGRRLERAAIRRWVRRVGHHMARANQLLDYLKKRDKREART